MFRFERGLSLVTSAHGGPALGRWQTSLDHHSSHSTTWTARLLGYISRITHLGSQGSRRRPPSLSHLLLPPLLLPSEVYEYLSPLGAVY